MNFSLALFLTALVSVPALADLDNNKVVLGKLLFNDTNLSEPAGQSCASCHQAEFGHSDQNQIVSPGANPAMFGNRNAPSIHYVKFNPEMSWNAEDETWIGGFFLDGRAPTLKEQAKGPFLNPLEMGNSTAAQVLEKIQQSAYAGLFKQIYGATIFADTEAGFDAAADAISIYEQGPEFALFTSKYDYYLRGKTRLSALEQKGLELFEAEDKGNCAACHPNSIGDNGEMPLFTDYSYDNLGAGVNPKLPFLAMSTRHNPDGKKYRDLGLAMNPNINNAADQKGKFKVPSLRNLELTAPYLHHGLFETLEQVVDFYNSRDIDEKWADAEVTDNVNKDELGDLKLTDQEQTAIIAFLKTLTDGYQIKTQ